MKLPDYAFFEDRRAPAGAPAAWRFADCREVVVIRDAATLGRALARIEAGGDWAVLALNYALGEALEPAVAGVPAGDTVLATVWRFARCDTLAAADFDAWLDAVLCEPPHAVPSLIGGVAPAMDADCYAQDVARIQAYIAAGDCYQVNHTFPVHCEWSGSALALYAALRQRQPVSHGGFIGGAAGGIVSLSPELFVERQGDTLRTRPMKGTAPRTASPESLRHSEKDRAENLMIVDLLRNDLGRLARPGSVKVTRLFDIEDYPTVWQMTSEIVAEAPRQPLYDVLSALFPCGSITGAPKIRAMQIARELEQRPRGLYTGSLGWHAPGGDFRLNVAIRTLLLDAGHRGEMGVGSGIVADSEAAAEWRECLLKSRFLSGASRGVQLIETLRREAGVYPLLEGHLARLSRSAAWLGFPLDLAKATVALAEMPAEGIWRVRLTLDSTGDISVHAFALGESPAGPVGVTLADLVIDPDDPARRHKTTARGMYDAALAQLPADVFDAVFLNTRGEVAEGARTNIFVRRDGVLLTPPVASGALPGVLRARLLACGEAREAVLMPADLADGFFVGNALRGLLPARWASA